MIKILVVEDEPVISMYITTIVKKFSYDVVAEAATGEEAITLSRQLKPDLVLMDIKLSGNMDGITAARWIRMELSIPSIFITAYTDSDLIERAIYAEPLGYIVKPIRENEVRAVIECARFKLEIDKIFKIIELEYQSENLSEPIQRYIWKNIEDDFILVDYNEVVEEVSNGNILEYIGYKASELYADRPDLLEIFSKCSSSGKMIIMESPSCFRSCVKDKIYQVIFSTLPPNLVVVACRDISKNKTTIESLRAAKSINIDSIEKLIAEIRALNQRLDEKTQQIQTLQLKLKEDRSK